MADEYKKAFEQEGRELGISATSGGQRAPLFRDEEIELLLSLLDRRRSVLLTGPEGVGKTLVVYAAARRLRQNGGRRIREFSTIQLLAGTKYIGEWQTKLTSIIKAARKTRTILFITDVWNLPDVGKTSSSADNLWDALRPYLEKREVQLIGEVTPNLLDNLQKAAGFSSVFEIVRLKSLSPEQINAVIRSDAEHRGIVLEDSSCNRLVDLCERFLPASHGPGPALRLLERAQGYAMEKDEIGQHEPMNA